MFGAGSSWGLRGSESGEGFAGRDVFFFFFSV